MDLRVSMMEAKELEALAVFDPDGARTVSVGANICLYLAAPLEEISENVLSVYEAFLEICPKEQLVWYLTNSMEKHEPVTRRTFGMPKTWLTSKKKSLKLMSFELKNSISKYYSDAPDWKFRFLSRSRDNRSFPECANYIEFLFPCNYLENHLSVFQDFARVVGNRLPFLSGHAGYTFEVSRYYENRGAFDRALSWSMRFKQIDISEPNFAEALKVPVSIKGINWLTFLGEELTARIKAPAREKYKNLIFEEIEQGLIVQAGERPVVVDGNRREYVPAYQEAYDLLKPLFVAEPVPLAVTGEFGEQMDKTMQWMHRFKINE